MRIEKKDKRKRKESRKYHNLKEGKDDENDRKEKKN